jgi:hypothetical protein
MPRKVIPVAVLDRELKTRIAREIFEAIHYSVSSNLTTIDGVQSCDIVTNVTDGMSVMIRVRVDHGPARGLKYHFYTLRLSETTL